MALPSDAHEHPVIAVLPQTTELHTAHSSYATVLSEMSILGMPEIDSYLHEECWTYNEGILDPGNEVCTFPHHFVGFH